MRNLFLLLLAALVAFSQLMTFTANGKGDGIRPIYWATVRNPSYQGYADKYIAWRKANGLSDERIVIDMNSFGLQKTLVQGVSGVAADVIDSHHEMPYYRDVGLIENLDQFPDVSDAVRKNFESFPWLKDHFLQDGHLYIVPTRYHTQMIVLNLEVLEKYGMKNLPFSPDLETFEKIAMEFRDKANAGKSRREHYFCGTINLPTLLHGSGLSLFNETGTGMAVLDPKRQALMDRYQRWVNVDHIIPTPGEMSSFTVEYTGLSAAFSLFYTGHFAGFYSGRYAAIFMRQMKRPIPMGVMMPPNGGYPVVDITYGGLTLYRAAKSKERALEFMKWCTTSNFAKAVVESSDAMPPFPGVLNDPEFLHPSAHTNEWNFHPAFAEVIKKNLVCSPDESPFLIGSQGTTTVGRNLEAWTVGALPSDKAWKNASDAIEKDLIVNMHRRPDWQARFDHLKKVQKEIDQIKAEGKKIPLEKVMNPFLRQYYRDKGLGV